MKYSNQFKRGATLEIDLRRYFNTIPHDKLQGILAKKIADKRFLKLVEKLIRAPVLSNGKAELNRLGCPQGSIISPILSNIYLHHVMDSWFSEIRKSHLQGKAELGWVNYHAISDNQRRVSSFIYMSRRALFRWINRKGGQRKMNWTTFDKLPKEMNYPHKFKTTSMFTVG